MVGLILHVVGGHSLAVSQLLLGHGADVNAKTKGGRTPLLAAAGWGGTTEVCQLLLERGADATAHARGSAALHVAAEAKNHDVLNC